LESADTDTGSVHVSDVLQDRGDGAGRQHVVERDGAQQRVDRGNKFEPVGAEVGGERVNERVGNVKVEGTVVGAVA
jgi:hypothetical protein